MTRKSIFLSFLSGLGTGKNDDQIFNALDEKKAGMLYLL